MFMLSIITFISKQLHFRYDKASKHKRNLFITGGVSLSVLAAPVIAGLTVGKLTKTLGAAYHKLLPKYFVYTQIYLPWITNTYAFVTCWCLIASNFIHIKGYIIVLMHSYIVNGHRLLCHAHTVPELLRGNAALLLLVLFG